MIKLPSLELRRQAIQQLIDAGVEPSPGNLLKAAQTKKSPLYEYFRSIPEHEWAEFGKIEACRRILHTTKTEFKVGGATIKTRMSECVRIGKDIQYAPIQDILKDKALLDGYMREVQTLNEQAAHKMNTLRLLLSE